jgi:hypothetical protein
MNKPEYHGKHCANGTWDDKHCPYCVGSPPYCSAYQPPFGDHRLDYDESDRDFRYLRLPACISEHGLDGSQWSREVPTEEGFYWAEYEDDPGNRTEPVELIHSGKGWWVSIFNGVKRFETDIVLRWGPRIDFPELPEDSNEQ